MARNTGKGSRPKLILKETTWIKNPRSAGVFAKQKANGGKFEGVKRCHDKC